MFHAQRDLAAARNNELHAILDYNRSLVDFEAVQEVPIGEGSRITSAATGQDAGSTGLTTAVLDQGGR